jgi:hypothetical protein
MINTFLDWAQMQEGGELSLHVLRYKRRRGLIWGDTGSLDRFDGTDVSLGSEPSSPLPIKFVGCPQMLNTTSQPKCL